MNKPIKLTQKQTLLSGLYLQRVCPFLKFLDLPSGNTRTTSFPPKYIDFSPSPSELFNMKLNILLHTTQSTSANALLAMKRGCAFSEAQVLGPKWKILKLLQKVTNITKVTLPSQRSEIKNKFRSLLSQGSASFSNGFLPGEQVWWKKHGNSKLYEDKTKESGTLTRERNH